MKQLRYAPASERVTRRRGSGTHKSCSRWSVKPRTANARLKTASLIGAAVPARHCPGGRSSWFGLAAVDVATVVARTSAALAPVTLRGRAARFTVAHVRRYSPQL